MNYSIELANFDRNTFEITPRNITINLEKEENFKNPYP